MSLWVGFASVKKYPRQLKCPAAMLVHLHRTMKKLWRYDDGNFYHEICRYGSGSSLGNILRLDGIYGHHGPDRIILISELFIRYYRA